MASYYLPKGEGRGKMEVTIKEEGGESYVYGPSGKKLGKTKSFPKLQDADGNQVAQPTIAPSANSEGVTMDEGLEDTKAEVGETVRENEKGLTQTGKKLGIGDINGLFASLSNPERKGGAIMTAGDLPSASNFFSEALATTPQSQYQGGDLKISTDDAGYEVGAPVSKGTKIDGSQVSYQDVPGYEVPETSVPMTTGRDGNDAQEGVSDKPDIAEEVRTIRMNRNSGRGSRKDPRNRDGGSDEPFGGVSETKGNGMTAERRAAVSAFLDPRNKGYGSIRAADRAVGTAIGKYGVEGIRIGDEFVAYKPEMGRDARFELRGGGIQSKDDAQEFLKKYTNALSKPDPAQE